MTNEMKDESFHLWAKIVSGLVVLPGLVAGVAVGVVAAPTIFEKLGGESYESAQMIWLMAATVGAWVMVVGGVCSVIWLVLISLVEASIGSLERRKKVSKVGGQVGDFNLIVGGDAVAKGLEQDQELVMELVRKQTAMASKDFLIWMTEKERRETEEWLKQYESCEEKARLVRV